ncbi:MAG: phosphate ABC transporter ATP-binding protein [Desulfobacca sp.]|uniref:phosphate ABC transporter ATP-binding protein n=1 Tax=Desulfobacca sp. TaxID=2067990 RepID=UPI00404A6851
MATVKMQVRDLTFYYGAQCAIQGLNLDIYQGEILGLMGPAKSGKTTFLRVLNRMCDLVPTARVSGSVLLDGAEILGPDRDVDSLRRRVGMVFAKPVPLPRSIYENLAFAPRLQRQQLPRQEMDALVENSLKAAQLWEEVKDRLHDSALKLSGGQQQRLCLARTLAMQPEVILLDEPTSGLDPISTARIEETLTALKKDFTIVLVSNNTKQIARCSDKVAFLLMSRLVEYGVTPEVFMVPKQKETDDYISGRFG